MSRLTNVDRIIIRLSAGPATNAELADLLFTHCGDIARTMAKLRQRGCVVNLTPRPRPTRRLRSPRQPSRRDGSAAVIKDRPLAIDLYTGLSGWAEGLIAAGWRVIGFDIVDMHRELGEPMPEGDFLLVLQDVLTLHGAQFKDAQLIVGSSPCQEFSYRAMPWKRAKALGPPELGMALYHAQFRIRREASEAAGRPIPLVVENVRGAQPWIGRAAWNFGSYYLWGDVPALMPPISARKVAGFRFDGSGRSFQTAAVNEHIKNTGGSWFNVAHNTTSGHGRNPDGRRGDAMRPPARVSATPPEEGRKGVGSGAVWFDQNTSSLPSASPRRKAASAKIAKIPLVLSTWIGRAWFPLDAMGPVTAKPAAQTEGSWSREESKPPSGPQPPTQETVCG